MSEFKAAGRDQRSVSNLLVLKRTQLRMVVWVGLLMGAMSFSFCFFFIEFAKAILPQDIIAQLPSWRVYMLPIVMISIIYVICGILYGLYISHRVVGPIYQLGSTIKKVIDGDTNARVHFRPGDEFLDLGNDFNAMVDKLTGR